MLRPRYYPGWKASWVGTKKDTADFEDGLRLGVGAACSSIAVLLLTSEMHQRLMVMDAMHISDGCIVVLKKVNMAVHPYEAEIGRLLSAEPLASNPCNHAVPIYDVLQSPLDGSTVLLVMLYLMWHYKLQFETIGKAVECFHQLFEVCCVCMHSGACDQTRHLHTPGS